MINSHQPAIDAINTQVIELESRLSDYTLELKSELTVGRRNNLIRVSGNVVKNIASLTKTLNLLDTDGQPCKAAQIAEHIAETYKFNGLYYSPQAPDLIEHLKDDLIDNNEPSLFNHNGYTSSLDSSFTVFQYDDGSTLFVSSEGVHAHG